MSREFLAEVDKDSVDWEFVFKCWELPEREFQYLASDYLHRLKKILEPGDIRHLKTLITKKSWWDTCDTLSKLVGEIAVVYPSVTETILEWSTAKNIWLRRAAIIHQLPRGEKTDERLLERIILNNVGETEFFIAKAIGWSLREYSKLRPDWVRDFLIEHGSKMERLSVREGEKHLKKRE